MSDDKRDKRRPFTPPAGVQQQIARPMTDAGGWDDQLTPVEPATDRTHEAPVTSILRRTAETKNTTLTTLDRVNAIDDRVTKLDGKVDAVIAKVADVREDVGKLSGQNELIIKALDDQRVSRQATEHVITTARVAQVEIDRTRALADIEETKADKALRRKLTETAVFKLIAGIGIVWAAISAYYLTR